MPEPRRFYRSPDDRVLAGVCGGLAEYFEMDPKLVRIIMTVLLFASGGAVGIGYLIAMVVVPERGPD